MKFTYEKFLIGKGSQNHIPVSASLELLPLCNMNCKMCYVRLSKKEMDERGKLLNCQQWLEIARQMQQAGTLFVTITGGEPLLYPDFKEVYLGLKKLGMIITINTNGTLIDESWADFFKAHLPRRINVTLYGGSEDTYEKLCHFRDGYHKAIKAIKLLRQRGVDVKINGSIVKENYDDLMTIIDQAKKLEVPINIDTYMYPVSHNRHQTYDKQVRLLPEVAAKVKQIFNLSQMTKDEYYQMAKQALQVYQQTIAGDSVPGKMQCQAGKTSFSISWQGYLRPCVMLSSPAISLLQQDLKTAWQQLGAKIEQIELCRQCSVCTMRDVCDKCGACMLHESGDFLGVPDYMCQYTKAKIKLYQEYVDNYKEGNDDGTD